VVLVDTSGKKVMALLSGVPADWRNFNNLFGPAQAGLFCNEDK
jgi:hypothetical protein